MRVNRVHNRAVERFGKRVLAGGDMYLNHMKFLESNRSYESNGSPNLQEQKEWMNSLSCIKMELDGTRNLDLNVKTVVEKWLERLK